MRQKSPRSRVLFARVVPQTQLLESKLAALKVTVILGMTFEVLRTDPKKQSLSEFSEETKEAPSSLPRMPEDVADDDEASSTTTTTRRESVSIFE
ncbi:unnamed protein product [Caenorhabditis auriculariae]|uniref:Uncharacterized protein n=1 Tax=Caenorhabditis auriculariae TaxID=2777116 RepID=A0A8S1HGY1_9PELO|nr:unnamed protein product [Caenorhabditis auriculariae]